MHIGIYHCFSSQHCSEFGKCNLPRIVTIHVPVTCTFDHLLIFMHLFVSTPIARGSVDKDAPTVCGESRTTSFLATPMEGTWAGDGHLERGHWQASRLPFCEVSFFACASLWSPSLSSSHQPLQPRISLISFGHIFISAAERKQYSTTRCTFAPSTPSLPHFGIPIGIVTPPEHRTPATSEHQHDVEHCSYRRRSKAREERERGSSES